VCKFLHSNLGDNVTDNIHVPGIAQLVFESLWTGGSLDRMPVGARFSAPVQTGPVAHPVSYAMGTGSFPGVKPSGRGA